MKKEVIIEIENLKKEYTLGQIGAKTLTAELQSWWAKKRGKNDPNLPIDYEKKINMKFMALKGINLKVYKGDTLGIIGGNGAGKSTLLKILSRITAPTEGVIRYNGRLSSMLEVGTGFNAEMTGRENIYMNGAILGMSKREVDKKIDEIIEFSECRQFIDTPVKRYSSGMYVKLAFAVSAYLDSEILIMDEVLAVGDMKFQQKCLSKMRQLAMEEERTVLYVSHNMSTIEQLCNRCIVLREGEIVYDGNVETAINVYLETQVSTESFYDFSFAARFPGQNGVMLDSLCYLNKQNSYFAPNEKIYLEIKWHTEIDISEVYLRMDICYVDNSHVGIIKCNLGSGKAGEKYKNILEFDCTSLRDGKYYYRVSLRKHESLFDEAAYDVIHQHIGFEIGRMNNEPEWNHLQNGHTKLGDIKIIQKEKC